MKQRVMCSKLMWYVTTLFLLRSKPQRPCTLVVLCVFLAQGVPPDSFWGESMSPSSCGNEEEQDCSCLHVLSPPTLISYYSKFFIRIELTSLFFQLHQELNRCVLFLETVLIIRMTHYLYKCFCFVVMCNFFP